jgi:hypothetical protein
MRAVNPTQRLVESVSTSTSFVSQLYDGVKELKKEKLQLPGVLKLPRLHLTNENKVNRSRYIFHFVHFLPFRYKGFCDTKMKVVAVKKRDV